MLSTHQIQGNIGEFLYEYLRYYNKYEIVMDVCNPASEAFPTGTNVRTLE